MKEKDLIDICMLLGNVGGEYGRIRPRDVFVTFRLKMFELFLFHICKASD